MQTIYISPQTDTCSHTNTLSLNFYRPDAPRDAQLCQSTASLAAVNGRQFSYLQASNRYHRQPNQCLTKPEIESRFYNNNHLTAVCPGQPGWAGTRRNIHPLTPILVNVLFLSPFSICNGPRHPLYSAYVLDSPLEQPVSRSFLVFLVLNPQLHTPCISSPNHHYLFAAHAHTNAA